MGSYATKFTWVKPTTSTSPLVSTTANVVIVPVFQDDAKPKSSSGSKKKNASDESPKLIWSKTLKDLDLALAGSLKPLLEAEKFSAGAKKVRVIPVRSGDKVKAQWVVLLGLGKADKLDMRAATASYEAAFKACVAYKNASSQFAVLPEPTKNLTTLQLAKAAVFGASKATYQTQEAKKSDQKQLKTVQLYSMKTHQLTNNELDVAAVMARAESAAKDLANMPANLKTAQTLADFAKKLKGKKGVEVKIISNVAQIKRQFPAFFAVAQGSVNSDPPRFIHLTYKPSGKTRPKKHIALVGKGVIFDTGGVQVKPGDYMNDMKFDMTGAATVLAAFQALVELQLPGIQVSTFVAATRNATGEHAYLPDSIIDSSSGKKIEIRHTDAEGRLTLADAVHAAVQQKPDEMVTIATLTGAAMIAVGECIALMGTDDALVGRIDKSAKAVGERVQALDIFEEDYESIKSDLDAADIRNTSKVKHRGHLTAGAFVLTFAGDVPAAHLDIAGGDADNGKATGIAAKGLIQYLLEASKSVK